MFGFNISTCTANEDSGSVIVCVTLQQGNIGDSSILPFRVSTQETESAQGAHRANMCHWR